MKSAAGKDSQQQAGEVGFFSHFDSQMHFSVSRLPSKPPASQSSIVHISNWCLQVLLLRHTDWFVADTQLMAY